MILKTQMEMNCEKSYIIVDIEGSGVRKEGGMGREIRLDGRRRKLFEMALLHPLQSHILCYYSFAKINDLKVHVSIQIY